MKLLSDIYKININAIIKQSTAYNQIVEVTIGGNILQVEVTAIKSNLGKGLVYYFICPLTAIRCRELYYLPQRNQLVHRTQIRAYYQSQMSYYYFGRYKALQTEREIQREIQKKHFKKFYKGQITKRYKYLLNKLEKIQGKIGKCYGYIYHSIAKFNRHQQQE